MSRYDDRDDGSLLEAIARGDVRSLRLLFDRHAPWLAVRLRRRCNDEEVVADVLSGGACFLLAVTTETMEELRGVAEAVGADRTFVVLLVARA